MLAFLNPKVAVFFIALFSQVVGPDTPLLAKLAYAATAMVIDIGWYMIVAWLFSSPGCWPASNETWSGWSVSSACCLSHWPVGWSPAC